MSPSKHNAPCMASERSQAEAPTVKTAVLPHERGWVPTRGPRNSLQAQIYENVGSARFASFESFAVGAGSDSGGPDRVEKAEADPPHSPSAKIASDSKPAAAPAQERGEGCAIRECVSSDRNGALGTPEAQDLTICDDSETVGILDVEGLDEEADQHARQQKEKSRKAEAEKARTERFLNRMRGTEMAGSKEKSDKKEKKKDKKAEKEVAVGPEEPKSLKKEKKKKKKEEKEKEKIEMARKREEDKERALVAAERATKRLFGHHALEISSDES